MKIGIFETEHYEGSYPVIKLFDVPENKLSVFTSTKCFTQFQMLLKDSFNNYQWIIKNSNISKYAFFITLYKECKKNKFDILYINTVSDNHFAYALVLAFLPKTKTVLTIHDINCLFLTTPTFSLRGLVKHYGKKMLLSKINEFNVVSETMVQYLSQIDNKKRKIYHIPGAVFEGICNSTQIKENVKLVVIGSIDKKRRDYYQVFDLLALAENLQLPLHITLLGGNADDYGKEIINMAKKFVCVHTKLVYFETEVVAQDIFDEIIAAEHFIFIPSVIETKICGSIPEIYGVTKSSGNIFDGIKHSKPIIIPNQLKVPQSIESSCFRYTKLADIITLLTTINNKKQAYALWEKQAFNNSQKFTIKQIRGENPSLFKS